MNNSKEYTEEVYNELIKLVEELEDYARNINFELHDILEKTHWINSRFYFEENYTNFNDCKISLFGHNIDYYDNQINVCIENIKNRLVEFLLSLNTSVSSFEFNNSYKFDGKYISNIVINLDSVLNNIHSLKCQITSDNSEERDKIGNGIRRDIRQIIEDINYLYTANLMVGKNKMASLVKMKVNADGGT